MYYRFIIAIDVDDVTDLKEAYRKLYRKMRLVDSVDCSWESTDEAYNDNADEIPEGTLQEARMAMFKEEESRGTVRLLHDYSDGRYSFREFTEGKITVDRAEYERWCQVRELDKEVQNRILYFDNRLYDEEYKNG